MSPPALLAVALAATLGLLAPRHRVRRVATVARPRRPPARRVRAFELLTAPLDRFAAARERRRTATAFPDAVELLVLAVRAGASPTAGVHDVRASLDPSLQPAFAAVVHRLQRGHAMADAVRALPEHLGPMADGLADAIAAAERYGTPLGPVLDTLAADARATRRRTAEARARTLSVRLSFPLVTCTLPAFVLLAVVPAVLGALDGLPTSPIRA